MFPRYAEIKMWKYHKAKLLQEFCQRNSKTKLQYYRVAPLAGLTEKAGKDTPFIVLAGMGKPPFLTISVYFCLQELLNMFQAIE